MLMWPRAPPRRHTCRCILSYRLTHAHTDSGGPRSRVSQAPGVRGRQARRAPYWAPSAPFIGELQLPRASPSTQVLAGAPEGFARGPREQREEPQRAHACLFARGRAGSKYTDMQRVSV